MQTVTATKVTLGELKQAFGLQQKSQLYNELYTVLQVLKRLGEVVVTVNG